MKSSFFGPEETVDRTREEWLGYFRNIIQTHFPDYTVKEDVPVTELTGDVQEVLKLYESRPNQAYRAEWGKNYDFVLYAEEKPKTVIMLGNSRNHTKKVNYLISRMFAQKLGVPYLGFHMGFANREDYVIGRIREQLG